MKTIDQIAAELQGYDPQALRAADVNTFLERLVAPVTRTEEVGIFDHAVLDHLPESTAVGSRVERAECRQIDGHQ